MSNDNGYGNYWTARARSVSRRSLLRGAGVASMGLAAAALIGCGDDDDDDTAAATTSTPAAGGTTAAAATATTAAAAFDTGDGSYTQPTGDPFELTTDQFRAAYDGDQFNNLPSQKTGPVYGSRASYPGAPPSDWSPLQASGSRIASTAFASNQLVQVTNHDFVETTHKPQPWLVLAESIEQPDDLTYTFKIHKGVKYHNVPPVNGREMTAADIKYVYEQFRESPAQSGVMAPVSSIDEVDDYTVTMNLSEPSAPFIPGMSSPTYHIFAKEHHTSAAGMHEFPIGTGAYVFESSDGTTGYSFDKNPEYFRKDPRTGMQLPYLDGLDVIRYQSQAASTAAFRAGDLDYINYMNKQTFADVMDSNPGTIGQICDPPPIAQNHFGLRLDKEPFSDVRVRRALSMLIDRQAIIDAITFGLGGFAYGNDWSYWDYKWTWPLERLGQYNQFNPDAAMKLLAAAGVDEGLEVPMFFGTSTRGLNFNVYSAATAMWEGAGIKVDIQTVPDVAARVKVINEDKSVEGGFVQYVFPPGIDPDNYTFLVMKSGEPNNIYYIDDPKIDDFVVAQRRETDPEQRKQILTDLMDYDLDQTTRIWLINPDKLNLRHPNVFNITDNIDYWSIFGWGPQASELVWKSSQRPA